MQPRCSAALPRCHQCAPRAPGVAGAGAMPPVLPHPSQHSLSPPWLLPNYLYEFTDGGGVGVAVFWVFSQADSPPGGGTKPPGGSTTTAEAVPGPIPLLVTDPEASRRGFQDLFHTAGGETRQKNLTVTTTCLQAGWHRHGHPQAPLRTPCVGAATPCRPPGHARRL